MCSPGPPLPPPPGIQTTARGGGGGGRSSLQWPGEGLTAHSPLPAVSLRTRMVPRSWPVVSSACVPLTLQGLVFLLVCWPVLSLACVGVSGRSFGPPASALAFAVCSGQSFAPSPSSARISSSEPTTVAMLPLSCSQLRTASVARCAHVWGGLLTFVLQSEACLVPFRLVARRTLQF